MFQRAVVRRQADREDKKYRQGTCLRMHLTTARCERYDLTEIHRERESIHSFLTDEKKSNMWNTWMRKASSNVTSTQSIGYVLCLSFHQSVRGPVRLVEQCFVFQENTASSSFIEKAKDETNQTSTESKAVWPETVASCGKH